MGRKKRKTAANSGGDDISHHQPRPTNTHDAPPPQFQPVIMNHAICLPVDSGFKPPPEPPAGNLGQTVKKEVNSFDSSERQDPRDPRKRFFQENQAQQNNTIPKITPASIKQNILLRAKAGLSRDEDGQTDHTAKGSAYASTGHSGAVIEDDIYVSDGSLASEDEDNEDGDGGVNLSKKNDEIEIVLSGSRLGVMRRGLAPFMLQNQWVRDKNPTQEEASGSQANVVPDEKEEDLDPAVLAARTLAEKQRKLEQAKESARRLESCENAGRDPCLFSKRTAFDIRMDQIEDKPWVRGTGDPTDYFNYGLQEEDWIEYAERQLAVRQELTDANRQKRLPDPSIVPVLPKTPSNQTPKVAVSSSTSNTDKDKDNEDNADIVDNVSFVGPDVPKPSAETSESKDSDKTVETSPNKNEKQSNKNDSAGSALAKSKVIGGAWGAGAKPGSVLAMLIEQQTQSAMTGGPPGLPPPPPPRPMTESNHDEKNLIVPPHQPIQNQPDQYGQQPPPPHFGAPPPLNQPSQYSSQNNNKRGYDQFSQQQANPSNYNRNDRDHYGRPGHLQQGDRSHMPPPPPNHFGAGHQPPPHHGHQRPPYPPNPQYGYPPQHNNGGWRGGPPQQYGHNPQHYSGGHGRYDRGQYHGRQDRYRR